MCDAVTARAGRRPLDQLVVRVPAVARRQAAALRVVDLQALQSWESVAKSRAVRAPVRWSPPAQTPCPSVAVVSVSLGMEV